MVVLIERVAVQRELGRGQGAILTRIPKVIILGHLALVLMLPWLSGITEISNNAFKI